MSAVYLSSGVASEITPVPGGVGPVTNVALMRNVVSAARDSNTRIQHLNTDN